MPGVTPGADSLLAIDGADGPSIRSIAVATSTRVLAADGGAACVVRPVDGWLVGIAVLAGPAGAIPPRRPASVDPVAAGLDGIAVLAGPDGGAPAMAFGVPTVDAG